MFGRNFFRQKAGKRITARTLNRPMESAEASTRVATGSGLQLRQGPGGIPLLRGGTQSRLLAWAKTGVGGIPAATGATLGYATATFYKVDGSYTRVEAGAAGTVFNGATGAVAANTWIIVAYFDGYWQVIWEDCPVV